MEMEVGNSEGIETIRIDGFIHRKGYKECWRLLMNPKRMKHIVIACQGPEYWGILDVQNPTADKNSA